MLAVYFLTTTNSPSEVKWMLGEEKEYLQQALGESSPKEVSCVRILKKRKFLETKRHPLVFTVDLRTNNGMLCL